jgi:hypothetical protein
MNERIKQLMDQADIDVEAVENLGEMPAAIKFAELIIEECASLFPLQHTDEQYPRRISKTIKKHFGMYP